MLIPVHLEKLPGYLGHTSWVLEMTFPDIIPQRMERPPQWEVYQYKADAYLPCAVLTGWDVRGDCSGMVLDQAVLDQVNFARSVLRAASFVNAVGYDVVFREVNCSGANFRSCSFAGGNFRKATLYRADFTEANLTGANLQGSVLDLAIMKGARLKGADLSEVEMTRVDLQTTQLEGVCLNRAKIHSCALSSEMLKGADLTGADLRGSTMDGFPL